MPIPDEVARLADEIGVKLEIVDGLGIWEGQPLDRHQSVAFRIETSIKPLPGRDGACGCYHAPDVIIRFPDGSEKRPDIAIFCEEPPADEIITTVPAAVVEVISAGYEKKDIEIGAPFYLRMGVRDVILFDPRSLAVTHLRPDGERQLTSPVRIDLECGCTCEV